VERLYNGAHQSKVDADTAAQVIGYANSSSGAAAGALGALRQFGLLDGLRGDVQVSDLAMRILQPMTDEERVEALHEAANRPEIFSQIVGQFPDGLPKSDAPIGAFLVRQLGFSQRGASEIIGVIRSTLASLPEFGSETRPHPSGTTSEIPAKQIDFINPISDNASNVLAEEHSGELIALPLGQGCKAELRFIGEVTVKAYDRLIRHLELLKETLLDQ
jgi:hypothetical protein